MLEDKMPVLPPKLVNTINEFYAIAEGDNPYEKLVGKMSDVVSRAVAGILECTAATFCPQVMRHLVSCTKNLDALTSITQWTFILGALSRDNPELLQEIAEMDWVSHVTKLAKFVGGD